MKKSLFALGALLFVFSASAAQAGPTTLGTYGYWSAYRMDDGGGAVCYMTLSSAPPPAAKGAKKKRGAIILMLTHRPAEASTDVVSYTVGAKFKPASDVSVQIDDKTFNLFTQDDTAWARDVATDHALAFALRAGQSATFRGTLASGALLADKVSLKGSNAAYSAIGKACSLPVAALAPKTNAKKAAGRSPSAAKP